jgi:serine/threonine protein kinase
MLLRRDGTIQLSDFGIAKISEIASLSNQNNVLLQYPTTDRGNEESLTSPPASPDVGDFNRMTPNRSNGFALGTPAYAAPEQSLGKPCPASDQYALAIVVYEWLTGQRPFQGDPLAVMLHHQKDAPPPLRSICPEVPPHVEQVILKALAKAPEDRFPTITHFAQALHTAQQNTIPTQILPNPDTPSIAPTPIAPVLLPEALPSQFPPEGVHLTPAKPSLSPQPTPTSSPSVRTPDAKPLEINQSSKPTPAPRKWSPTPGCHRTLIGLLCIVLLLGEGAAAWLLLKKEQPAHAGHPAITVSATTPTSQATSTPAPSPTPTPSATSIAVPFSTTPTPLAQPSATPGPRATPTPTPTPTPTATATPHVTPTPRITPTFPPKPTIPIRLTPRATSGST